MREVMNQAQKLGESILKSDIYLRMQQAEDQIGKDQAATLAVAAYMEKRDAVEKLLGDRANLDPAKLAELGSELQQAENEMNQQPLVQEMQAARKEFEAMMASINRVLELVINGSVEEMPSAHGCTGSCATCGGCGAKV